MPQFRRTDDYVGEINRMVGEAATPESIQQRLASEGLPAERIHWLIRVARRARWHSRLSVVAKVSGAVAIAGMLGGIAFLVAGWRLTAAVMLLTGAAAALLVFLYALAFEAGADTLDWDPRGLVPPEFAWSPRNVRRTRASAQKERGLIAAVLLFGLGAFLIGASDLCILLDLRLRGLETTGIAINRHVSHGRSTTWYLEYRFNAKGTVWIEKHSVGRDIYDRYPPGSTVPVTYDPDRPRFNRPLRTSKITPLRMARDAGFPLVAGVYLPLSILFVRKLIRKRVDAQLRLARVGVVTIGEVVTFSGTDLTYRFIQQTQPIEGRVRMGKRKISFSPKPGDRLVILYDEKEPMINEPLLALNEVEVV